MNTKSGVGFRQGCVAQGLEQCLHKAEVGSSILPTATINEEHTSVKHGVFFYFIVILT